MKEDFPIKFTKSDEEFIAQSVQKVKKEIEEVCWDNKAVNTQDICLKIKFDRETYLFKNQTKSRFNAEKTAIIFWVYDDEERIERYWEDGRIEELAQPYLDKLNKKFKTNYRLQDEIGYHDVDIRKDYVIPSEWDDNTDLSLSDTEYIKKLRVCVPIWHSSFDV